ncbi:MAG: hypothetical protein KA780_09505, partial [Prolixibacteraceae bacterium]|nr:hypothetical protein [Prolixibacteraceae bacterium]
LEPIIRGPPESILTGDTTRDLPPESILSGDTTRDLPPELIISGNGASAFPPERPHAAGQLLPLGFEGFQAAGVKMVQFLFLKIIVNGEPAFGAFFFLGHPRNSSFSFHFVGFLPVA